MMKKAAGGGGVVLLQIIVVIVVLVTVTYVEAAPPRPTVLWHGMGDTCCYPFRFLQIPLLIPPPLTINLYISIVWEP